jgi:hypothetical protein
MDTRTEPVEQADDTIEHMQWLRSMFIHLQIMHGRCCQWGSCARWLPGEGTDAPGRRDRGQPDGRGG